VRRVAVLVVILLCALLTEVMPSATQSSVAADRDQAVFTDRVVAGQRFERCFGPDFRFVLEPEPQERGVSKGWTIAISRLGGVRSS
jgi:hypothetical protein